MDIHEFGPLTSAEPADVTTLGQDQAPVQQTEADRLHCELVALQHEIDELRTQAYISELGKEDEVAAVRRKCREEIASLHHIMREAVAQAQSQQQPVRTPHEDERPPPHPHLHADGTEARARLSPEREGFLSTVAKTLQKRVGTVLPGDHANLEDSMRKAQEDAEILKSVVLPLEQEISQLKSQLAQAEQSCGEQNVQHQDSCDLLQRDLAEEREELEMERRDHSALKHTWQMANDQFLASQRQYLRDTRLMESLLTAEQQTLLEEEREKGAEKEENLSLLAEERLSEKSAETPREEPISEGATLHAVAVTPHAVSAHEWALLQSELQAVQGQVSDAESNARRATAQVCTLERQLSGERAETARVTAYCGALEAQLHAVASEAEQQMSGLARKLEEMEKHLALLQRDFSHTQCELRTQLGSLTADRSKVQEELTSLQEECDVLAARHSKHSQQLQEEDINLPNSTEELQLVVLQYREQVIRVRVGQEHAQEQALSQIHFLKNQVLAEQTEKARLEEALSQELASLQAQLDSQSAALRSESTRRLAEAEAGVKAQQAKSKQLVTALQGQIEEQSTARVLLEEQVAGLRGKVASLQLDLNNSEAVQRDFVKLSQSLQVQLEKIRSAEHEVRWQHEDDITDCSSCKNALGAARNKHHCRHCGKIFCSECVSKSVLSGPSQRPTRVCDVCHTILVQDAKPYFSCAPPASPD